MLAVTAEWKSTSWSRWACRGLPGWVWGHRLAGTQPVPAPSLGGRWRPRPAEAHWPPARGAVWEGHSRDAGRSRKARVGGSPGCRAAACPRSHTVLCRTAHSTRPVTRGGFGSAGLLGALRATAAKRGCPTTLRGTVSEPPLPRRKSFPPEEQAFDRRAASAQTLPSPEKQQLRHDQLPAAARPGRGPGARGGRGAPG